MAPNDPNSTQPNAYYYGRQAYGTRQRCPYVDPEMVAEWKKGRDDARRSARKDLRPQFRRWKRRRA